MQVGHFCPSIHIGREGTRTGTSNLSLLDVRDLRFEISKPWNGVKILRKIRNDVLALISEVLEWKLAGFLRYSRTGHPWPIECYAGEAIITVHSASVSQYAPMDGDYFGA